MDDIIPTVTTVFAGLFYSIEPVHTHKNIYGHSPRNLGNPPYRCDKRTGSLSCGDFVMLSGIYGIFCEANSRVYIGSSIDIAERVSHHMGMLRRGSHHNIYLQRAWDKYGEESFTTKVIEQVGDISELQEREQYWIDKYCSLSRENGFNISPKAQSQTGYRHTPDTKRKMSKSLKGVKKPEGFGKKVSESLKRAGIRPSREALEKAAKTNRPYPEAFRKYIESIKGTRQSEEHVEKRISKIRKRYVLTSPDGREILIDNLPAFCDENNLLSCKICDVCRGRRKHHKGWRARYA